jgi:bifunctional ADP-heptose synthase (sugar kinase/adenylyltransferase)
VTGQIEEKILYLGDMIKKVRELRGGGKVVVQSHGIFDIIHPGILKHLDDAKGRGDVLIVTVVMDKDVRKGPGRPVFPANYRLHNVASLQQVDYVCLVDDDMPFSCVKEIKPDIFARGQGYAQRDREIHSRIFEEERELYFGKCRILETEGFSFSSSSIINNFLNIYPEETKIYLKEFAQRYSFNQIMDAINSLRDLKVLLIGDGIIDEYFYCESMGKSPKAQLIVHKYLSHDVFAGGVFAIANHLAAICGKVHMVTMLGTEDTREDFVRGCLKPNVDAKFFYRDDAPTIVKRRYINSYQKHKIFEVNYINA